MRGRVSGRPLTATVALTVAGFMSAAVLGVPAPASAAARGPMVRAVIAVTDGTRLPFAVPGGRVLASMPHLDTELVSAPASELQGLAGDPHVVGIAPDRAMRVAGYRSGGSHRDGVLASQFLGGVAGRHGTGTGVTVALLDTGVSDTPALSRASGRLQDGVDVSRLAAGDPARKSGLFTDGYGHGTFMASLIAGGPVPGSHGRALGIAPAAHVVVVKVADSQGTTTLSQVLAGLDWVAANAHGIQIANLSLAQTRPTGQVYGADPLTAGIEHVRAAGVLVVVAAGNTPGSVGDPGDDPQALTVGAADVSDGRPQVASFSGGAVVDGVVKPDIVAPGAHVLGEINPDSLIAREHPGAYTRAGLFLGSGTSEATAVTTGVAAAYLSAHPGARPLAVKTAIRTAAQGMCTWGSGAGLVTMAGGGTPCRGTNPSGVDVRRDPTGEASFDANAWQANAWLGGAWENWLASSWSASSWSGSSWAASSWSASSWSDAGWGDDS